MNKGTDIEQIDVQIKLPVMKLLHLVWLIELYNYVKLSAGREACMKKKMEFIAPSLKEFMV